MTQEAVAQTPELKEILRARRSPRTFSAQQVSDEQLRQIFEAARWAASSFNEQPWRFFLGRRGDETHGKIFSTLVAFNQAWAKSAPVLMLSVASRRFARNGSANRYALHDTGAATAYLALQASGLGLFTHAMGGFSEEKAREAFSIGEEWEVGSVIALGYLGNGAELTEEYRQMEQAPRERKELSEIILAEWNRPAAL